MLALRSQVTVLEQDKKKCAQAESKGLFVMNKKEDKKKFDYVFNTAPTHVADEKFLSELSREVTIIDIASKGTGVDFQYCKENQLNAHLCLGLPGKYAPKSSAAILLKVIEDTLGE